MPKMIVSIDGVVIKEVQLTKDRTTLGRRPYNDIVIDNLAVSGEHAVLQMTWQRGLPRRPQQHQRHLREWQGREEAAVAEQRHGRDRQVQDQVHQRGGRSGLRKDHDHQAGLGRHRGAPAAPAQRCGCAAGAAPAGLPDGGAGTCGDQGAVGRGGRARGPAGESRDHHRQARRRGGCDHQAAAWVRGGACRRRRTSRPSTARRSARSRCR